MNKQPLLDIMKDDIDRIVDENVRQVREEADARLKKEQQEADARLKNASANHIRSLMNSLGVTIDKAMDLLLIPQSERELYIGLVKTM